MGVGEEGAPSVESSLEGIGAKGPNVVFRLQQIEVGAGGIRGVEQRVDLRILVLQFGQDQFIPEIRCARKEAFEGRENAFLGEDAPKALKFIKLRVEGGQLFQVERIGDLGKEVGGTEHFGEGEFGGTAEGDPLDDSARARGGDEAGSEVDSAGIPIQLMEEAATDEAAAAFVDEDVFGAGALWVTRFLEVAAIVEEAGRDAGEKTLRCEVQLRVVFEEGPEHLAPAEGDLEGMREVVIGGVASLKVPMPAAEERFHGIEAGGEGS